MKVRLSENMVRCRLRKEDVSSLAGHRPVVLTLAIPPTSLTVVLQANEDNVPSVDARGGLRIGIPGAWLIDWPQSDVVGFDFDIPLAHTSSGTSETGSQSDDVLRVVIEKDFPCGHDSEAPPKPVRMS